MKPWLLVLPLALWACSAPPPPARPPATGAAEISVYVTNAADVPGETAFTWIEIKDEYETRFDNSLTLTVGHNTFEALIQTGKDGGYYKLLELEQSQNSGRYLPFNFFLPGELLVVESDGRAILYFKYEDSKVYLAKVD